MDHSYLRHIIEQNVAMWSANTDLKNSKGTNLVKLRSHWHSEQINGDIEEPNQFYV